ncbi:MAG: helix-turn-helix domain-containing protein [Streptosporangiaceae bacterium]|nr:helix-turn-helix domain-containing protein [Streptosporangiaceae bacterium]MBV9856294.1 helix-turn-helix domain-containing protein [Streptosporangiaceae bacterium]
MGRPENPVDPSTGPLAKFAWDLRQLRKAAGRPPYRQLARRAGYSDSALSGAASGRTLPSLEVTLAFVGACGGDMAAWERRWHELAGQLGTGRAGERASAPPAQEQAAQEPAPRPTAPPDPAPPGGPATGRKAPQLRLQQVRLRRVLLPQVRLPRARLPRLRRLRRLSRRGWVATAVAGTLAIATPLTVLMLLHKTPGQRHERAIAAAPSPSPKSSPGTARPAPSPVPHHVRHHHVSPAPSPSPVVVVATSTPTPTPSPAQSPSPTPPPHRTTPPPKPTTFAALAGPGCASDASYGGYPAQGWIWQSSGGYCGGFLSHWITGSNASGDTSYSTYTWWFKTGLSSATCSVGVYAPAGRTTVVGGHPGHYHVYTGSGQNAGNFDLDERDNMGSWLSAGSFPDTGTFWVVLDNAASGSHQVAASALSVDCRA